MSSLHFYISFVGFALGIIFFSIFGVNIGLICFSILLAFLCLFLSFFLLEERQKYIGGVAVLLLFFFFVGGFRYFLLPIHQKIPESFLNKKVAILGTVMSEPVSLDFNQKFVLFAEKIILNNKYVLPKTNILVKTERYPQFVFGDRVEVLAKIQLPENFQTDGAREFDYINYLAKDDIYYTASFAVVKKLDSQEGFVSFLYKIKESFIKSIYKVLPDPHASLGAGILLGAKKGLSETLQDILMKAGIIHVVVLSGYNVAIVLAFCMSLLSVFSLRLRLLFASFGILIFAVLVGGGATVIRASIMALLAVLARATGRIYSVSRALFLAAFVMLLINPKLLVFDPSFQLSFLAAFGIIHFYPAIKKYFDFLPEKFYLREFVGSTLSVQIFILPLLLYMTGNLSIVSFPINILVLPLVPIAMASVFVAGVFGFISVYLAMPFSAISFLVLEYMVRIATFGVEIPKAVLNIQSFSFGFVVFIYIIFALLIYKYEKARVLAEAKTRA